MWGGAGKAPTVSISEQPRRLLLPQEVKELGSDRMLLFYEGLRPVLAHRVLYFRDRFFAPRERPPPPVPRLDVSRPGGALAPVQRAMFDERNAAAGTDSGAVTGVTLKDDGPAPVNTAAATRGGDALAADLKLDDFLFDFDDVEIPTEKLSEEDLKRHADEFMARILD
jgi:type IV secretion system protein VirD4